MDKEQAIELAQRYKAIVAERLPLKSLIIQQRQPNGGQRHRYCRRRGTHERQLF